MNSVRLNSSGSRSSRLVHGALLLLLALPFAAVAASVWEINLVGDMSDEGRALPRPAPGQPIYYYPIVRGYTELGPKQMGLIEQPPAAKEIVHHLAAALSAEGYFVTHEVEVPAKPDSSHPPGTMPTMTKAFSPPPSLILVFHWGALRAEKVDSTLGADATAGPTPPAVINQDKMIGLIAGKKFDSTVDFGLGTEKILEGVQDDRYFVMISAYDFKAYFEQHKKVMLWAAKMSVPTNDVTMAQVLPTLIDNGGAVFGRETIGPKRLDVPAVMPDGKVDVGTPTVVEPKK
jgi:hypothetical protein